MRWVITIVLVLALLVGAIVVVGLMLPKDHVATRSQTYGKAPQEVWNVISNIDDFASWHPNVTSVQRLPDRNGHPVWREHYKSGGMSFELLESRPTSQLKTRIVDESSFGGTWTVDVAPAANGSTVTITENGEIYNPVFRTISRYVLGYTATMDGYLTALGKKLGA